MLLTFKYPDFIIFHTLHCLWILFSDTYFPLLNTFPFRLLRFCKINGDFLHWTPTRIDYLFPFIFISFPCLSDTKKQTADHRKKGHREKTEGRESAGRSLTAVCCWFFKRKRW